MGPSPEMRRVNHLDGRPGGWPHPSGCRRPTVRLFRPTHPPRETPSGPTFSRRGHRAPEPPCHSLPREPDRPLAQFLERVGLEILPGRGYVLEVGVPERERGDLHVVEDGLLVARAGQAPRRVVRPGEPAGERSVVGAFDEDVILVARRAVVERFLLPIGALALRAAV